MNKIPRWFPEKRRVDFALQSDGDPSPAASVAHGPPKTAQQFESERERERKKRAEGRKKSGSSDRATSL